MWWDPWVTEGGGSMSPLSGAWRSRRPVCGLLWYLHPQHTSHRWGTVAVIPRSLFVHVYRCTISSTVYAHTIRGGLATTNSNLRFTFCLQWYKKAKELQKGRGLGKRQYLSSILCHVQFEISGCYITVIVCAYKASLMVHACMYDADTESCTLPGQPKCNPTD